MKSSLVSREVIADSIELMVRAHQYDALVGIAGCDKSLPGTMMAMARLDVPSVFVYGGTIMPGSLDGGELTIVDVYEAVGAHDAGGISAEQLGRIEDAACPGAGSCGGMFTANTMASISEAIGISLPGSASPPAEDARRAAVVRESGAACARLLETGTRPRDIMTFEAFENAVAVLNAVGGSTNGILHLLAMAHEAGVKLSYEDFERVRKRTPHIADMKPGGGYVMSSLDKIGGVPVVLKKAARSRAGGRGLRDGDRQDHVGEPRGRGGPRPPDSAPRRAPAARLGHRGDTARHAGPRRGGHKDGRRRDGPLRGVGARL